MAKSLTQKELYDPAMEITDQQRADEYLETLVQHHMANSSHTREEALRIERENLAYYAGYWTHETRLRVERLFQCVHPVFGPAENGPPDPYFTYKVGYEMGKLYKDHADEISGLTFNELVLLVQSRVRKSTN